MAHGAPAILLSCVLASAVWAMPHASNESCAAPLLGDSTTGLLETVAEMQNSLGFAGLDSIRSRKTLENSGDACRLKYASVINKHGTTVKPSSDGAQAAVRSNAQAFLESSCPGFGLCAEIYDGRDADVWPISTLTYLVVPTNTTDQEDGCDKMKTVYDYVKWILTDSAASQIAMELSMATMPAVISLQAQLILDKMRCYDRQQGWQLVKDRKTRADVLAGSGSSLQAALQTRLTNQFFQQNFVSISYNSSSSGIGRAALRASEFDFAGSDSVLDMTDPEFIQRGMKMIPAFAAAVGVVFNVNQVEELVLSRDAVQKMFSGEIFSWRDPAIVKTNPDFETLLPDEAIVRVVRAAKSGTTSALTKALYAFAGHPTGPALDYSLHVLQGSGFPVWPAHPQPYPAQTTCKLKGCIRAVCEQGQFLDMQLPSESCTECPPGSFAAERGQHTACQPCPAGTYTTTAGNAKCFKCDDRKYQDESGQDACKSCPAHTRRFSVEVTLENGATTREQSPGLSAGECKCTAGYWLPDSVQDTALGGLPCQQCPDGASCSGFPHNIPQTKRGFWGDPAYPHEFFECQSNACLAEYRCADGTQGRMCSQPAEGYFTVGELWFVGCPAQGFRALFTLGCVMLTVLVWNLIHHLSLCSDAFAIAFLFFQNIGIISQFRLRWHPNLNLVLIALRIINFDVDFVGPQCLVPGWNQAAAYFVQLLLPAIVVLSCAAYFLLARWIRQRRGGSERSGVDTIENKGYLRSAGFDSDDLPTYLRVRGLSYFIMMFHTLAFRALSVFVCEDDASGGHAFMVTAPTVECWRGAHIGMVVCSLLFIPGLLCGVPLLLLFKILRVKRQDRLCDASVAVSLGFVFAKFEAAFPFWELVLLARRLVLVLLLVFVHVSMLQAALAIAALNAFLCLHLTHSPFKDKRVGLLDSFGVCCSMAYAVCGMLFYPSLDGTLDCVGSANLDELGDQCRHNSQLKQETSVILLLLLLITLAAALFIFFKDLQAKLHSAAAARRIEEDKKWYGKDKLLKFIRKMPKLSRSARVASLCQSLGADPATLSALRTGSIGTDSASQCSTVTTAGKHSAELLLAESMREVVARGFADREKLNLCDMLVGDGLQSWHQSLSTRSATEVAVRLLFPEQGEAESESVRQELAYMDLEMWVTAFAVRNERLSGFYADSGLARTLRALVAAIPELLDWLAVVEPRTVQAWSNVVHAYTVFLQTHGASSALRQLVLPAYRAPVVHWLAQCAPHHQKAFLRIFSALRPSSPSPRALVLARARALLPRCCPITFNKVAPLPAIPPHDKSHRTRRDQSPAPSVTDSEGFTVGTVGDPDRSGKSDAVAIVV